MFACQTLPSFEAPGGGLRGRQLSFARAGETFDSRTAETDVLLEIEQVALQRLPHLWAGVDLRVADGQVDREMLFERNLVLHWGNHSGLMLSLSSTSCQVLRSSAM